MSLEEAFRRDESTPTIRRLLAGEAAGQSGGAAELQTEAQLAHGQATRVDRSAVWWVMVVKRLTLVETDLAADNGVIHVIDTVRAPAG